MRPVLRRIAIHGGLTAIMLAIMGYMLSELAAMWLGSAPDTRDASVGESKDDIMDRIRVRVPLAMAVFGFLFVALGEYLLHMWWSRKPATAAAPPQLPVDPAERLLEELLAQAEATRESGAGGQEPEGRGQQSEGSSQRTEDRRQEPGIRGQRTEDKGQEPRTEVGGQEPKPPPATP